MGETNKQARQIRITGKMLAVFGVLAALILLAAVYVVPRYAEAFSAYRVQSKIYRAAHAELTAAQNTKADLEAEIEELKTLTDEANAARDEAFQLASQLEKDILNGKSDKKICYITIDDGPYNRGNEYLKLFHTYDIKATFFLTTANGDKLPDQGDITATSMYPEYLKYGHTIGNHTYSHNYSAGGIYSSAEAFMKSVEKQQDFTAKATGGYRPKIIRFPGGTSMAGSELDSIQEALRKSGYGWINWTVDSGDSWGSEKATESQIKKNVINASKDKDNKIMVVLFHEWSQNSLNVMPDIIETLEGEGYIFLPLFYDSVMVEK